MPRVGLPDGRYGCSRTAWVRRSALTRLGIEPPHSTDLSLGRPATRTGASE